MFLLYFALSLSHSKKSSLVAAPIGITIRLAIVMLLVATVIFKELDYAIIRIKKIVGIRALVIWIHIPLDMAPAPHQKNDVKTAIGGLVENEDR